MSRQLVVTSGASRRCKHEDTIDNLSGLLQSATARNAVLSARVAELEGQLAVATGRRAQSEEAPPTPDLVAAIQGRRPAASTPSAPRAASGHAAPEPVSLTDAIRRARSGGAR